MLLRTVVVLAVLGGVTTPGASVPPAAIGDAVFNAASGINQVTISETWKRLADHVSNHAALKQALRRLRVVPAQAARVAHALVERLRAGDAPSVKTTLGTLRGRLLTTKTNPRRQYYSFKGVRYAQPPTGMFRFRAPRPLEPWQGTRDALEEGSVCPHKFILFDTFKGEEDCLFLNVYTPLLPDTSTNANPKLPVMVWFHGGGFAMGSGNSFFYGPDYLVAENVVLVTINYRLGTLGFLSLQNEEVPGNAGLKDQVLALKWVKNNIEFFGGDPGQVTIFGESAGAASVQYLMLSPMANGLYHKAISQSGWTLCPWALAENPRERAFSLGRVLGMDTTSPDQLLGFLRAMPSETLVVAAQKILTKDDARKNIGIPFVPVIEPNIDPSINDIFLSKHPKNVLLSGNYTKVPYLTGFNSHEGLIFIRRLRKDPTILEQIENDFNRMIPLDLKVPGGQFGEDANQVANRIRQFYLNGRTVSMETATDMVLLLTDLMFLRPLVTSVRLQKLVSPETPIYMYRFAFDGALGLFKRFLGINKPGACHGDEMGYLFKFSAINIRLDEKSTEVYVKKKMVKMWTNFAKYGNPTPFEVKETAGIHWEPVSSQNLSSLNYMDITGAFTPRVGPESARLAFWDQLYREFNGEEWF
ncbi:juvenile hormone esterase [Arctopsyche grandis]|uniref:juvenile hormone esterase n=1 Tax=Arctopsyche grandis TaxID=121162 RepID=UPI00406D67E4